MFRKKYYGFYVDPSRDVIYTNRPFPTQAFLNAEERKYNVLFNLPLPGDHPVALELQKRHETDMASNGGIRKRGFSIPKKLELYNHSVSRLAIPMDDTLVLTKMHPMWLQPIHPDELFTKLNKLFPRLDELILVLFPNLHDGNALEDLKIVDFPVERALENGLYFKVQKTMMERITNYRNVVLHAGNLNVPRLTFMRNEKRLAEKKKATKLLGAKAVKNELRSMIPRTVRRDRKA